MKEERRLRGIETKEKGSILTGKTLLNIRYDCESLCSEAGRPDAAAAAGEEEEETKKEEDDWKAYIPEVPSAALFAVYTSPDTFWLSMVRSLLECRRLLIPQSRTTTMPDTYTIASSPAKTIDFSTILNGSIPWSVPYRSRILI